MGPLFCRGANFAVGRFPQIWLVRYTAKVYDKSYGPHIGSNLRSVSRFIGFHHSSKPSAKAATVAFVVFSATNDFGRAAELSVTASATAFGDQSGGAK